MNFKSNKLFKILIPIILLSLVAIQLVGCGKADKEAAQLNREPIDEVLVYNWQQLDQLKTYNEGFRQSVDDILKINNVTVDGVKGKSGCIYVDTKNNRNGNTSLADAFRNREFVENYWINAELREKMGELSTKAYKDVADKAASKISATINAYYNLVPSLSADEYNGNQSLTREMFYSMDYRAQNGVKEITADKDFETKIGGKTAHSLYAQEVDEYGFLSIGNRSLDKESYSGTISRAEAIYMVVNEHFSDELAKVDGNEKSFKDVKNGGDIALKQGFREKKDGNIVGKDMWQSYTLAYMMQNNDSGKVQEEIYKAMVVAYDLGLVLSDDVRWDEPLSKDEGIQLLLNVHLAKSEVYGYLSDSAYGTGGIGAVTSTEKSGVETIIDNTVEDTSGLEITVEATDKLENGTTMGEVRGLLDTLIKDWTSQGKSKDTIQRNLEYVANDMGFDLDAVMKLPVEAPVKEVKTEVKDTATPAKEVKKETTAKEKPAKQEVKKGTTMKDGFEIDSAGNPIKPDGWSQEEFERILETEGWGSELGGIDLTNVKNPFDNEYNN